MQYANTTTIPLRSHGKNLCISVPAHDLGFIDDLTELANAEFMTKSQFVRKVVREQKGISKQAR